MMTITKKITTIKIKIDRRMNKETEIGLKLKIPRDQVTRRTKSRS